MPASWSDEVDRILDGDLTAALAYVTPAGGSVVTAVAPIGLRNREGGTVGFTTSLGLSRKLERMKRDPRIALAYHARKHGFAPDAEQYVLVQGDAEITLEPDERYLEQEIGPRAERYLGPRRSGFFWDRWLREYYRDRVPVDVSVRRIVTWPDLAGRGQAVVSGEAQPGNQPAPQSPPKGGTSPRIDCAGAARKIGELSYVLLAYRGADGYPVIVPVEVTDVGTDGLILHAEAGLLPPGGRRAGLLAHDYGPQAVGISARQHTGWLNVEAGRATYAPHTEQGFKAPSNKTLLLLGNGFLAKRGFKKAQREGTLERLRAA